jgi:MFS family permease
MTLIVGRAIQGAGGAGVTGGCYIIIAIIVAPPKVPAFMGMVGAVFSIASVAGPIIGGVFTQQISWRWWYGFLPVHN